MALPAFNTMYNGLSDEVARLATSITIETGAVSPEDENYGPDNLVDENPAKVAKIEATTGAWLFAYNAKQPIEIAALIHHNFDATSDNGSLSVRLEGNDTDSWGAPSFSAEFTIPDWFATGTRRWPVNPYLILTSLSGYDPAGFLYWRLVVENNSEVLQLGQVWFGSTIRIFDPDLRWGPVPHLTKPQIENSTSFLVDTIYPRGTTRWAMEADLMASEELSAALEQHWYDVDGRAHPWLLIPSGPIANDRAYFVRYASSERQMQWNFEHQHEMRMAFQEVGRGLRPGL